MVETLPKIIVKRTFSTLKKKILKVVSKTLSYNRVRLHLIMILRSVFNLKNIFKR